MSNVALLIYGTRFVFWESLEITRDIDAVSSIRLSAPFNHEAPGFKENFAPFGFAPMVVIVDGFPLFTGTMMDVSPVIEPDRKTIQVNAYAKCGVLGDCTPPVASMPLEFNKLNLQQIATKLAEPFNVGVTFREDPGPAFERVACDPDKKILDFLTELAKQRGFVISSAEDGSLLFWKSAVGEPVARLEQGFAPLTNVTPDFNPQEFYSEMTGLAEVEVDKPAQKTTVKTKKGDDKKLVEDKEFGGKKFEAAEEKKPTPKAPKAKKKPKEPKKYNKFSVKEESAAYRPLVFRIDDVEGVDVETATKAAMGRMLGNMAAYTIDVSTWYDPQGGLWAPNTKIMLKAPDAMVYDFYEFEIKSVTLSADADSQTAALTLSLPGAFSGEPPEAFPWEL